MKRINDMAGVIIRVAHRDVRVTAGGIRQRHRTSSLVRAVEFARAILGRLAARVVGVNLDLVFRHPRAGVTLRHTHHHAHLHVAPRFEFSVLSWPSRPATAATADPLLPTLRIERQTYVLQRIFSSVTQTAAVERLTRRLITRVERIEPQPEISRVNAGQARSAQGEPAMPPIIAAPVTPPVRRIFRRATAVEAESEASSRSAGRSRAELRDENEMPNAIARASDLSIDVPRLTDQVIQAIDRRIVAQRERMGRP